jgi:hypothetical protein
MLAFLFCTGTQMINRDVQAATERQLHPQDHRLDRALQTKDQRQLMVAVTNTYKTRVMSVASDSLLEIISNR